MDKERAKRIATGAAFLTLGGGGLFSMAKGLEYGGYEQEQKLVQIILPYVMEARQLVVDQDHVYELRVDGNPLLDFTFHGEDPESPTNLLRTVSLDLGLVFDENRPDNSETEELVGGIITSLTESNTREEKLRILDDAESSLIEAEERFDQKAVFPSVVPMIGFAGSAIGIAAIITSVTGKEDKRLRRARQQASITEG